MREILKVILPAIGTGLFVYGVGMAGVIAYDKLFFAQKLKNLAIQNPTAARRITRRRCAIYSVRYAAINSSRTTTIATL